MKVQLIKGTFKNALKKKKRKRMPYKTHLAFTHLPYFLISLCVVQYHRSTRLIGVTLI